MQNKDKQEYRNTKGGKFKRPHYIQYKHTTYYVDIETGEVLTEYFALTHYIIINKYNTYDTITTNTGRKQGIHEHIRECKRSRQRRIFD